MVTLDPWRVITDAGYLLVAAGLILAARCRRHRPAVTFRHGGCGLGAVMCPGYEHAGRGRAQVCLSSAQSRSLLAVPVSAWTHSLSMMVT